MKLNLTRIGSIAASSFVLFGASIVNAMPQDSVLSVPAAITADQIKAGVIYHQTETDLTVVGGLNTEKGGEVAVGLRKGLTQADYNKDGSGGLSAAALTGKEVTLDMTADGIESGGL